MIATYHSHIAGSGLRPMIDAAVAADVRVLGISEHLFQLRQGRPLVHQPPLEGPLLDLEDYVAEVTYTAAPGLRVCLGLEVDYNPPCHAEITRLCAAVPWDFLIGSVHEVEGESVHARRDGDFSAAWAFWRRYCLTQAEAVRTGAFDILAHPLRLARAVPPPPYLGELIGPVLEEAAALGVVIELNGADIGADPDLQERLLGWCHTSGARVTFGADAHRPRDIAQHATTAGSLLRRQGFAGLTGFRRRRPTAEALPPSPRPGRGHRAG